MYPSKKQRKERHETETENMGDIVKFVDKEIERSRKMIRRDKELSFRKREWMMEMR